MNINSALRIYDALGLPKFPITVNLEPTNACQLRCKTCYRQNRPVGFMSPETFDLAADQIYKVPTISIIKLFLAGEPLLHPRLPEMVDHFTEKKTRLGKRYWTQISTNGSIPFVDYVDRVDSINVSLGGLGRRHEINRAGSSWEAVHQNIMDCAETRRCRTKLSVNMVQTDETDCEIEQFLTYWQDKVDSVFVARYHSPKLAISGAGQKRGRCLYLHHSTAILWDGRVTTCCSDLQGTNAYGHIQDGHMSQPAGPLCETCDIWKL